ncbi:hypothetical protein F5Y17DRAFT_37568 [Xylariaceae sp. FL0594]|nr:hypothetical protein F5Y17DRAFT_37568 [Xylariaceae sp. FL0594]
MPPSKLMVAAEYLKITITSAIGVLSVVTDFYVLAIPITLVLSLRLPRKRKYGVCAVFFTGLLACFASTVAAVLRLQLLHSQDFTWLIAVTYLSTAIELNIGIICSCMSIILVVLNTIAKHISQSLDELNRGRSDQSGRRPILLSNNNTCDDPILGKGASFRGKTLGRIPRGIITGLRVFRSRRLWIGVRSRD